MRVFVLNELMPLPRLPIIGGGGRKRDGSNNDGAFVCFFTGVRCGDDFRLPENVFNILALQMDTRDMFYFSFGTLEKRRRE